MQLRPAREADIPALQAILRNSWLVTWAPALSWETVQHFAATDPAGRYAEEKWREFVVADDGGTLRGLFHLEGNHLHAIHLDPAQKRRGIGSLLMDEVERRIARDHAEAELEVRTFNTGAIAFYTRRGWAIRGEAYSGTECGEPCKTYRMAKVLAAQAAR